MPKKGLFLIFLLLFFCSYLAADSRGAVFGIGMDLVKPMHSFDFSTDIFGGFDLRWKFNRILGASLDFYYIKQQFYDYNGNWYGPQAFTNINAGSTAVSDWIFYHTETVIALNLILFLPLGGLQPYFATGPAWLILTESDAADYYPEFNSYFQNYKNNAQVYIGYLARLGLEVFIFDFFTVGTEFLFKVNRLSQFFDDFLADPMPYIQDRSHLVLTMRFWWS